ncbi:nanos homolog 1 [Malaclemys terrapin pileata]|uniref:nanos homolog 1 n=1 Tax=Malaclemys terrapin pileata TaxID=2991368 RepID=UPI0023A85CE8|nr:nanos homolog 1 [Malaclemys terrapin pileata]
METFPPGKLEQHQPVEFLQGARYGAKSHPASGNAFNSWNDYLGLATLITKAVGEEKGFGTQPSSVVVAATVQPAPEEDDEDDEEEEDAGTPYFEGALHLHDFDLCSHHHGESFLEERFADFSPFSGRASPAALVFNCSPAHLQRDRSPHAWGGGLGDGRLQAPQKPGSRLLKPELQVCVFCRNNKEAVALYTTHILKGPDGRVLCPVLRRYTCPLCGASGDNAHTIKYCPLSKMQASAAKQQLRNARTALGKKLR